MKLPPAGHRRTKFATATVRSREAGKGNKKGGSEFSEAASTSDGANI